MRVTSATIVSFGLTAGIVAQGLLTPSSKMRDIGAEATMQHGSERGNGMLRSIRLPPSRVILSSRRVNGSCRPSRSYSEGQVPSPHEAELFEGKSRSGSGRSGGDRGKGGRGDGGTRLDFLWTGTSAVVVGLAAAAASANAGAVGSGDVASAATVGDLAEDVLNAQILSYIREALPAWRLVSDADIQLRQITGGITNIIYKARNAATGEGLLVRIYGKDTDLLLDRRKEAAVFSELSTLGFGPRQLGEFRGGRVEELLDARAVTRQELLETHPFNIPQAIAMQLASLHKQRIRSSAGSPSCPVMWTNINKWLRTAKRVDAAGGNKFPLDQVSSEVAWLKKTLPRGGGSAPTEIAQEVAARVADGIVFAHNDLLSGNVLVGPREAKVISTLRLIDFEYSDYNFCGYDIANHFCECAGFDADFRNNYPSPAQRKVFLQAYIDEALPEMFAGSTVPDDVLTEVMNRVDRYTLASHLTWALWAAIQTYTSEIQDFDFAGYARKRLDGYSFHKGQFYA